MKIYYILLSLRPLQWIKNLIIFIPIFSSHLLKLENFLLCSVGFVSFSLAASSCYLLNDYLDRKKDIFHPINKDRPIASGKINFNDIFLTQMVLIFFNFLILFYLNNQFFFYIIISYYFLNIFYSLVLKKIFLIDIIILSTFYIIRIISGKYLINSDISLFLLSFAFLSFLYISCLKRYSEISSKKFVFRSSTRAYKIKHKNFLLSLSIGSVVSSSVILFYYLNSSEAYELYDMSIYIALLISLMYLIWGLLINYNFYKIKKTVDPTEYFLSNKITILLIIFLCIVYYVISI